MDILYLLIPIALVFVAIATRLFLWAVRSGQYDDLEMESRRILFDEEPQQENGGDKLTDVDSRSEANHDAETTRPKTAHPKNRGQ